MNVLPTLMTAICQQLAPILRVLFLVLVMWDTPVMASRAAVSYMNHV